MDEFGHGGTWRRETTGSPRTRPRAASRSTHSVGSGSTRERICSTASSTVSTLRVLTSMRYPVRAIRVRATRGVGRALRAWPAPAPRAGGWPDRGRRTGPPANSTPLSMGDWHPTGQTWLEAGEEPATAQQEEGEEAGRDEKIAPGKGQAASPGCGREHEEDPLQEDRAEPHQRNDHERRVTFGGPAGQALEQVAERQEPAHDEDDPRHDSPWVDEHPAHEKAGLDRHVAVPDHEVLRPEEVHPHDRHRKLQLGDVLDNRRRYRDLAPRVGPDGQQRQEREAGVECAHDEVAAEEPAIPRRIDRHHEVEAPQGDDEYVEKQERRRQPGPPRLVPTRRVLVEDGRRVREAAPEEQERPDRRARRHERDVEPRGLDRHRLPHPRVERRASREEQNEENQGYRQEPGRREREPLDGRRP